MYLILAFLLIPVIEIALFIQVGELIGLWPTVACVIFTAFLGTWLMRSQGRVAMGQLQTAFDQSTDPSEPLANGAMILVAGSLMIVPGFFTDLMGFLLLLPPVRMGVFRYLRSKATVTQFSMRSRGFSAQGDVIDGDFTEVRPKSDPNTPPSGWVEGPDNRAK